MQVLRDKFPVQEWHGSSKYHLSHFETCDLPGEIGADALSELKIKFAISAAEFVSDLDKPTFIVTLEEFAAILLADFPNPYEQTEAVGAKNVVNPVTGNYYTPVAVLDDVLILVRGWTSGQTLHWRVRLVLKSDAKSEEAMDSVESEIEMNLSTVAAQSSLSLAEKSPTLAKVRTSLFDFSPTPRAEARSRNRLRVKVPAGDEDW